jgi:hypothetical protein
MWVVSLTTERLPAFQKTSVHKTDFLQWATYKDRSAATSTDVLCIPTCRTGNLTFSRQPKFPAYKNAGLVLLYSPFDHLTRLLATESSIVEYNCAARSLYTHMQAEWQPSPRHVTQSFGLLMLDHFTEFSNILL